MTNLDYHFLVSELQPMVGGHLGKIYELSQNVFRFKVRADKEYNFIAELGLRAHLSKFIVESPQSPSNFAMLLRKYLDNAQIVGISQENDDRVFAITLKKKEEFHLIFEMFAKGNLVLTNLEGKIIGAYKAEVSKTRTIKNSEIYVPLPNKNRLGELPKKEPALHLIEGKIVGFSSTPTEKFPNSEKKAYLSVCEMADEYYGAAVLGRVGNAADDPIGNSQKDALKDETNAPSRKIEFILKQQISALKKFEGELEEYQNAGNFVYGNFELIEKVLKIARELKRQKAADKDIEKAIMGQLGLKATVGGANVVLELPDPTPTNDAENESLEINTPSE